MAQLGDGARGGGTCAGPRGRAEQLAGGNARRAGERHARRRARRLQRRAAARRPCRRRRVRARGVGPAGASYRRYLTPAQWEKRFSPSQASVNAVTSWLRSQGVTVESVTPDRMTVQASGSAAAVEQAFATGLGEYRHLGRTVRLASAPLTVPGSIAALITGVTGVDQNVATPAGLTGADIPATPRRAAKKPVKEIPQPEGFRNAPPCSASYAKKLDTTDPAYGGGYPSPLPYAVCGYVPAQLQGAYGLTSQLAGGHHGQRRHRRGRRRLRLAHAARRRAAVQPAQPVRRSHLGRPVQRAAE
ncbi:MAG TPA: protease pro-enzyme activation domain-containing protein, partial [Solirubrobacteraceae bacterium]